jgi:hypothetical protein
MSIGKVFVWPDLVGTPTDPDTAFATVGPGPVVEIGDESELTLELRCTAGVPRAWDVLVEVSFDAQTSWLPWYLSSVQCSTGATDTGGCRLELPRNCEARVSVRRWGGTANSRLAVYAVARKNMPEPHCYGQPLNLVNHQFAGIECWSDGAGAPVLPPIAPAAHLPEPQAAATQLRIPTGEADTLVIEYTVSALACTTVQFEVRESTDDFGSTAEDPVINWVNAGVVSQSVAQESCTGALGTWKTRRIEVDPGTAFVVLAQITGGGAATRLIARARLYRLGR